MENDLSSIVNTNIEKEKRKKKEKESEITQV